MSKGSLSDGVVFHAGFPNAAEDEKFGSLSLDSLVVKHRASTFFWQLESDVEERGWTEGSVLAVDRALGPREGSLVVIVADDAFLLCKFYRTGFRRFNGDVVNGTFWGVATYCVQSLQGATLLQGGTLQQQE